MKTTDLTLNESEALTLNRALVALAIRNDQLISVAKRIKDQKRRDRRLTELQEEGRILVCLSYRIMQVLHDWEIEAGPQLVQ